MMLHRNENLGSLWKEHILQWEEEKQPVAGGQTVVVSKCVHKSVGTPPFQRRGPVLPSRLG